MKPIYALCAVVAVCLACATVPPAPKQAAVPAPAMAGTWQGELSISNSTLHLTLEFLNRGIMRHHCTDAFVDRVLPLLDGSAQRSVLFLAHLGFLRVRMATVGDTGTRATVAGIEARGTTAGIEASGTVARATVGGTGVKGTGIEARGRRPPAARHGVAAPGSAARSRGLCLRWIRGQARPEQR